MTTYAVITFCTMVLIAFLAFGTDVRSLGLVSADREGLSQMPSLFSSVVQNRQTYPGDNPLEQSYDSTGDNSDDDDNDDDLAYNEDNNSKEEREDQLDQDDPVSTVTVTAVRGSIAWLPCDIDGGNNDGLPKQPTRVTSIVGGEGKTKDLTNTIEDRAYMVLWFKHHSMTIRHRNSKSKNKKIWSGGKPLYSFDVRGRPLAHALKWSSDEESGGFGPRASFLVFGGNSGIGRGKWSKQHTLLLDDYNSNLYDNSSRAVLKVTNVTEQDAGAYRCRVDFRDSPTRNYRIILRVIVPPDKMTITYNGVETEIDDGLYHTIGPVPEGGRLVLECRVRGGKPKPRVQWYSADGKVTSSLSTGTIIDSAKEVSYGNKNDDEEITTKSLVIHQLNRSHANSTFTCLAGNDDNNMQSNLRMTVLINMYLNVKSVRIVGIHPIGESENMVNYNEDNNNDGVVQATNLISGKWYTGECWAEGASPKAVIEWSIDGNGTLADEIPSSPTTTRITVMKQTEHSSRIRLRPTPSDDGRYLRCRAWNPDINTTKDNIKNKALLLNVQYPPIVKLSLGHTFDPSRIKTGDDVYFECKVLDGSGSKGKQRNRIEWYHNGHPILQNGSSNGSVSIDSEIKVVLLSAGTLVIRNVGRRHSGRYTCQCNNDLGMGRSRPVTLRVQYAPVCADDGNQLQLVGVEANENNVRIVCRVRADPADDRVQFEWLVWPGAAAAATGELHQQQSPSVVATGSYVTTALPNQRNDTAIGELVLPAMSVGVPDVVQYADRTSRVKKPIVLDTVSCRATNAVGRQQNPCLYHIIPASPPGPLTGCAIRLPKDQERHVGIDSRHHQQHHQRPTSPIQDDGEDKDLATISCTLDNDGGVRPVTYSLEIYESNELTTTSYGSPYTTADDSVYDVQRNKYRGEWLADNVTGTAAKSLMGGGSIEYRVNRKNLRLRNGPDDDRKHLTLSAYAANRMGRGPHTYFGSDNVMLLRHPWWWRGESAYESSTRANGGPAGTSSTEWWIMLSGGGDNDGRRSNASNGHGKSTTAMSIIAFVSVAVISAIVIAVAFLLWRRRQSDGRSPTIVETAAIASNDLAACGDKTGEKYSLLSRRPQQQQQQQQQRSVYPNLTESHCDRDPCDSADSAPDITIQQSYGKQFLVSIVNRGIPGPESCV
uniref:B-cell receptor CD22 n=1 Tax=Melanaphis sacchari TaxID=742174 RepID=A0A2H8TIZ6_9HEMI